MATKGHRSEFWQRLRAARAKSGKTQLDVSKALGLSRPAVALWESKDPGNRTQPTAEQVRALAELLNVPSSYLMDDGAETDEVYQFKDSDNPSEPARRDANAVTANAFWAAVRYQMLLNQPDVSQSFDVLLKSCGIETVVAFVRNRHMASVSHVRDSETIADVVKRETANLLWAEKAAGRAYAKHLLIWSADAEEALADFDADCIARTFGVEVTTFNNVNLAASHVLALH